MDFISEPLAKIYPSIFCLLNFDIVVGNVVNF